MLPTVNFCGIEMTRLLIGANPFGGFSHQTVERDKEMVEYYTKERIFETWERAWKAGINTCVTNNETAHVFDAIAEYKKNSGPLNWIAQISHRGSRWATMEDVIDAVTEAGCCAFFLHGGLVDDLYDARDEKQLRSWIEYGKAKGIPVGTAAHIIDAHRWVDSLNLVDFHVVPFFNCGSVHSKAGGHGEKFMLEDMPIAVDFIQKVKKPCIAYKVLGAGRINAKAGFGYAFRNIKPGDVINVGMYRGDNDNIVEEDAKIASELA